MKREETGYVYYENGSKNRKGTFSERNVGNKVVKSVTVPEAGERCHVYILDLYMSKLPSDAHKAGAFYFRPLPKPASKGPWYTAVPIGRNTLGGMVKNSAACIEDGSRVFDWRSTMDKKYSHLPGVRKMHDFMIVRSVNGEVVMKLRTHCHTGTPIESPLHVVDPTQSGSLRSNYCDHLRPLAADTIAHVAATSLMPAHG